MALTLKAWRMAKGVTQEELAKALNMHPNTYRMYENEPQRMSIEKGYLACAFLGVDFDDVIFLNKNATNM